MASTRMKFNAWQPAPRNGRINHSKTFGSLKFSFKSLDSVEFLKILKKKMGKRETHGPATRYSAVSDTWSVSLVQLLAEKKRPHHRHLTER